MEELFLYRYSLNYKGYLIVPVQRFNSGNHCLGCTATVFDPFGLPIAWQGTQIVSSFEAAWKLGRDAVESDINLWRNNPDLLGGSVGFVFNRVGALPSKQ